MLTDMIGELTKFINIVLFLIVANIPKNEKIARKHPVAIHKLGRL